jgi:hypothetical protein
MNTSDKINDEDILQYIEQWLPHEGFSDLNLMLDRGLLTMAIQSMQSLGAIDSNECCTEDFATEKAIEQYNIAKRDLKLEEKEFFKNMEVWINSEGEHLFVPQFDVDYFVGAEELIRDGYQFDVGYDTTGRQYKKTRI